MMDPIPVIQSGASQTVQILSLVLGFFTTLGMPFVLYFLTKMTNKTAKVVDLAVATHALVNSQHGVALAMNAELSEWKARQEPTAVNIEKAASARKLSDEHIEAQARADSLINKPEK